MRLGVLAAAFLLAGCLGAASEPTPPQPTGRIDGAVVNQLLQPFSHLNVTLVNLNRVDETSTLGGFTFRDVPPGTYTLIAKAPDTLGDVKTIEVRADQITRVILQLLPIPSKVPFVTSLKNRAQQDLAVPGQTCDACTWGTFLLKKPEEVVVRAVWDTLPVGNGHVTVTVADDKGHALASFTGTSPIELDLRGRDIPDDTNRLVVEVAFPDDFTPQPFDIVSFLDLYYNGPRST